MVMSEKKSYTIQVLRGFAIIAVVLIHNTPTGLPQVFCRPFLNFAVGLFLFLSGMLSNAEKWKPWKRIKKVIVPYFIWTLIYAVLYNLKTPAKIPIEFVKCAITGTAAATMYYIFVYCQFTLLIPLIDKLARSKYKLFGFLIAPAEIIAMRLIPLVLGIEMNKYLAMIIKVSCVGWFAYFYLGYLMGNGLLTVRFSDRKLKIMLAASVLLQIAEGYYYYRLGEPNCGTQLKLTSVLTGLLFAILAFRLIESEKCREIKLLYLLGEYSFGIYFSHLAVMAVLNQIPHYKSIAVYPLNALIALVLTTLCVIAGRRVLGKNSKYLAL